MSVARIVTKRIYAPPAADDGYRVLIMRLWPRGIRKERVDVWLKELGPIPTLLREFLDDRISWEQYVPRSSRWLVGSKVAITLAVAAPSRSVSGSPAL